MEITTENFYALLKPEIPDSLVAGTFAGHRKSQVLLGVEKPEILDFDAGTVPDRNADTGNQGSWDSLEVASSSGC